MYSIATGNISGGLLLCIHVMTFEPLKKWGYRKVDIRIRLRGFFVLVLQLTQVKKSYIVHFTLSNNIVTSYILQHTHTQWG